MNLNLTDRFNVAELQHSDAIPDRYSMPGNRHLLEASWGDVLKAALAVETKEEAEVELLMIAATHLHLAGGTLSWKRAFNEARSSIAWFAFACDMANGSGYEGKTDAGSSPPHTVLLYKRENTAARDVAFKFYGARIQLRDSTDERNREAGERMERIGKRIASKKARPAIAQTSLF